MQDLISRQELLNLIDHYIKHEGDARKKHSALFVKGMDDGYFRIRNHVLQMLPAQPEPCEDAVSRKDAIIQLSHNKNGDDDSDVIIQHDIETLKQLSPVTPKRKTGYWQITKSYPHNVYCSECHTKFAQTHWAVWEDGSLPRKFCPNCGAKMEE